jgi:hypothetical protein
LAKLSKQSATVIDLSRKYNHRKAECRGNYGYGSGRERKEFCETCPVSRECWRQTVAKGVTRFFPPGDVLTYNGFVEKWLRKYPDKPIKARRLAMKEAIKKGKYDPYLQIVIMNTRRGYEDNPDTVREFKGGVWYYHEAIAAYYV